MVAGAQQQQKKRGILGAFQELIGRVSVEGNFFDRYMPTYQQTVDATKPNYKEWDAMRRGKKTGFELSGLFVQPVNEITSAWVLGDGLTVELADDEKTTEAKRTYTNNLLAQFVSDFHADLQQLLEDTYGLGDQYVFIDLATGGLSFPSPDTVDVRYDAVDARRPVAYLITSKVEEYTLYDEYRADGRTLTIKPDDKNKQTRVQQFANPLGVIPVVHFANGRGRNERYGHPLMEPMYAALGEYNKIVSKMIAGVNTLSTPLPVIQGIKDFIGFFRANNARRVNADGTEVAAGASEFATDTTNTRYKFDFSRLPALLLGEGATFRFESAAIGFTNDARNALKLIFLLVLDFTRIPEVIWGNEMSSGRASSVESMLTFYSHITAKRVRLEGAAPDNLTGQQWNTGLIALFHLWLSTKQLLDAKIHVGKMVITWPELSKADEKIKQTWTAWAKKEGLLKDVTALTLSGLVENPDEEIEGARKEQEERAVDPMDAALSDLEGEEDDPEETGLPDEDDEAA